MTTIHGSPVDDETRCTHYQTALDIIAIKFKCCLEYYPCHLCHEEAAGHDAAQWPLEEHDTKAVLCGACKAELAIKEYRVVEKCPQCGAQFNPGCRLHTRLYFKTGTS